MVDFNKILEERRQAGKKLAEEAKKQPTLIVSKEQTLADKVKHLLAYHLGEMTEWEANFCYSQRAYCVLHPATEGTIKVREKVAELEASYCGTICHALNKAQIGHP